MPPRDPPGRGILVIVSSPSGAGKTTLTRRLLDEVPAIGFSVSYTTRPMRPGERDGVDYHFVDVAAFERMVEGGEFAEHAVVHGNRYGTAKAPIEAALAAGRDLIFDVDWQGGQALSAQWPEDALKIFILPPDLDTLASRLRRRATDAPDVIERRLRQAITELAHWDEYQFLIVNDDLERAYPVLRALYFLRRFGPPFVDGRDATPALATLAGVVMESQMRDPVAHARRLVAARER
ncbi:MAG: guanylate kinase [Kofleriaceae bacterium]|nr:guanylate kinase [Myxococcales bacterium]MCB9573463.1 guanylate kinase [Kofleriaceae bacterium]